MGYKCITCGAVKENGDEYFQVKIIEEDGKVNYLPTCTKLCASMAIEKYRAIHQQRANDIVNQVPKGNTWSYK